MRMTTDQQFIARMAPFRGETPAEARERIRHEMSATESGAGEREVCPDCGHQYEKGGCVGPPTAADKWAGVIPEQCDCDGVCAATPEVFDVTHGGNHAPLPAGVRLDPGFCEGCDAEASPEDATCPSACAATHSGREHDESEDGCRCAELCAMGPTCPGANAGLDRGCWRTRDLPATPDADNASDPTCDEGGFDTCKSCGHANSKHRDKGCYFNGTKASCRCHWSGGLR